MLHTFEREKSLIQAEPGLDSFLKCCIYATPTLRTEPLGLIFWDMAQCRLSGAAAGHHWVSLLTAHSLKPAAPTSSLILELLQSHVPDVVSEEDTVLDSEHKPKRQIRLLSPGPQIIHTAGITLGIGFEWAAEETPLWRQGVQSKHS